MLVAGAYLANTLGHEYFRSPSPKTLAIFGRLGTIMKPYGSIELHGCRVGAGASGRRLLSGMASVCRVPVSAGLRRQYGSSWAARFEGPTVTVCPGGMSLADWSRSVVGVSRA